MIRSASRIGEPRDDEPGFTGTEDIDDLKDEIERLRAENRRLAISLGGFSAFMATRGMLEDAWYYVHNIHKIDDVHG